MSRPIAAQRQVAVRGGARPPVAALVHHDAPEVRRQIHPLLEPRRAVQAEPVHEQQHRAPPARPRRAPRSRSRRRTPPCRGPRAADPRACPRRSCVVAAPHERPRRSRPRRARRPRRPALMRAVRFLVIPRTPAARVPRSASRSRSRWCRRARASSSARDLLPPCVRSARPRLATVGLEVAAVHHQLVHRHGPRHPAAPAADQDVGAATTAAEGSRPRSPPAPSPPTRRAPVGSGGRRTSARPAAGASTHRHGRAPAERGPQAQIRADAGPGLQAVDADAGAHEVEVRRRMQDRGPRVRGVQEPRRVAGGTDVARRSSEAARAAPRWWWRPPRIARSA